MLLILLCLHCEECTLDLFLQLIHFLSDEKKKIASIIWSVEPFYSSVIMRENSWPS